MCAPKTSNERVAEIMRIALSGEPIFIDEKEEQFEERQKLALYKLKRAKI